jgi:hypothetical protein
LWPLSGRSRHHAAIAGRFKRAMLKEIVARLRPVARVGTCLAALIALSACAQTTDWRNANAAMHEDVSAQDRLGTVPPPRSTPLLSPEQQVKLQDDLNKQRQRQLGAAAAQAK